MRIPIHVIVHSKLARRERPYARTPTAPAASTIYSRCGNARQSNRST